MRTLDLNKKPIFQKGPQSLAPLGSVVIQNETKDVLNPSSIILHPNNSNSNPNPTKSLSDNSSKLQMKLIDGYQGKNEQKVTKILETLIIEKKVRSSMILGKGGDFLKGLNVERNRPETIGQIKETTAILLSKEGEANNRPSCNLKTIQEDNEEVNMKKAMAKLEAMSSKNINSQKIQFTFWDYIKSYFWKSDSLNKKLKVLKEGKKRIDERLDIFNVLRKLREVDKLKVLLLENEQLVLFDSLPKPHLKLKQNKSPVKSLKGRASFASNYLRESRFIAERYKNELIALSYESLKSKNKPERTGIDEKLVDIYDNILE